MTFKKTEWVSSVAFLWIQKVTTKYSAMRMLDKGRDTPRSELPICNCYQVRPVYFSLQGLGRLSSLFLFFPLLRPLKRIHKSVNSDLA